MPDQITSEKVTKKTNQQSKITWIKKGSWAMLFVLLALGFARVPYIGQLIDGLFFSFLFGYAKYILYVFLFAVCICKTFNLKSKYVFSLRTIVFVIGLTIITCVFLGGLQIAVFPQNANLLNFYINDIWLKIMFGFSDQFVFGTNYFIDGGIFGVLIASIAGVFIILFAIFALVCFYFLIFRHHWYWVKNKILFKNFKKMDTKDQANLVSSITPPTATPKPTTTNKYLLSVLDSVNQMEFNIDDTLKENVVDMQVERQTLLNFLNENKITVADLEISSNEHHHLLNIKTSEEMITKIKTLKDYINLIGLNSTYNLVLSDTDVLIEYPKFKRLLNLGIIKLLTSKIFNPLEYAAFLDISNQPQMLNLQTDYFIGVFSNNNRDIENFVNVVITSLSTKYKPEFLDISVVSPTPKNFVSLKTKNTLAIDINDVASLEHFLTKIQTQIDNIATKIKETKVTDVYALNNLLKTPLKNHLIIIDQLDLLKSNNTLIYNRICGLQKLATLCGFTFICIDRSKTGLSFDDIYYSNVVMFNFDSFLAKKLLDKQYKSGIGDKNMSIIYNPNKKAKIEKIFIPQINDGELEILSQKLQ